MDVSYSIPRSIARAKNECEEIHRTVENLMTLVLKDFDHRHLNFTHPEFVFDEKISTTEVLTEVLQTSVLKVWQHPIAAPDNWHEVEFLGVQIWETDLLASSSEMALVSLSRPGSNWTTTRLRHQIRLTSGECRSLTISVFIGGQQSTSTLEASSELSDFLKNSDGQFFNLESLCCVLQENFGHAVLLSTRANYFLFAGEVEASLR